MTEKQKRPDIDHHTREWSSGSRGGGKVPEDLEWRTNPKQYQEESGTSLGPNPENPAPPPKSP